MERDFKEVCADIFGFLIRGIVWQWGRVELSGLFSICTSIAGYHHSFLGMPIPTLRGLPCDMNRTTYIYPSSRRHLVRVCSQCRIHTCRNQVH